MNFNRSGGLTPTESGKGAFAIDDWLAAKPRQPRGAYLSRTRLLPVRHRVGGKLHFHDLAGIAAFPLAGSKKNVPARLLTDARELMKLSRDFNRRPGARTRRPKSRANTPLAWSTECRFARPNLARAVSLLPNRFGKMAQKRFSRILQLEVEMR
jgi:hypothetical protein